MLLVEEGDNEKEDFSFIINDDSSYLIEAQKKLNTLSITVYNQHKRC